MPLALNVPCRRARQAAQGVRLTVQQAAATASASQLATNSAAKMDALRLNLGQARLP